MIMVNPIKKKFGHLFFHKGPPCRMRRKKILVHQITIGVSVSILVSFLRYIIQKSLVP